jgi:hypothetical protein
LWARLGYATIKKLKNQEVQRVAEAPIMAAQHFGYFILKRRGWWAFAWRKRTLGTPGFEKN